MRRHLKKTTIILLVICVVGLSLLLYPSVSNYINEINATKAINTYIERVDNLDEETYKEILSDAVQYNKDLFGRKNSYSLSKEMYDRYIKTLNPYENGVMGFIEIPKLDVSLPLYHGTSDRVLQHATGHVEWSSLPVGGPDTHCVLSGHRGLTSAKLFTELDKLREGDTFSLVILKEEITYEVDQIRTVLPEDVDQLEITKDKDFCTLVTCTPYGINTHRLLIRGHRIETTTANNVFVVSEVVKIDPLIVAPVLAFPLIFILFMMIMLKKPENRPNAEKEPVKEKISKSEGAQI